MSLTGKQVPHWEGKAVVNGEIVNLTSKNYDKKTYVLFFYPLDFTFVCPTEMHAFQNKLSEFKKRDVDVIACSVDSPFSHLAWLNTSKKQGGIKGVEYPVLSDMTRNISKSFEVLNEEESVALRGLFLIDSNGIVQHSLINNLAFGRNVDEVLRMIDALRFHEEHGEVCPANWTEGEKGMQASNEGLKQYFNE